MIKVLYESKVKKYEKNELIYYQNSEPYELYLVLSGEIVFKIFSKDDLLKMINASNGIHQRKRYIFGTSQNYSSLKQKLLETRNKTLEKGINDKNINERIIFGKFFDAEKLALERGYENCALAKTGCILLVISKNIFGLYLKNKIRQIIFNIYDSFYQRFKITINSKKRLFNAIINNSKRLFPEVNETIIEENEEKNNFNLYFIYEGKVAVNKHNLGDILYLNKGELFGAEAFAKYIKSLDNDNNQIYGRAKESNEDINNYIPDCRYNINNKSDDTILYVIDLSAINKDEKLKSCLNLNLLNYFIDQLKIIKKYEDNKTIIINQFKEKYKNISSSSFDNKTSHLYHLRTQNKIKNKRKSLINILLNIQKDKQEEFLNIFNMNKFNKSNAAISSFGKTTNSFNRKAHFNLKSKKNNSVTFKKEKEKLYSLTESIFFEKRNMNSLSKKDDKESIFNYERNENTASRKKRENNLKKKNVKLFSIYNNCSEFFKKMKRIYPTKFNIASYNKKNTSTMKNIIMKNNKENNNMFINKNMKKKRLSLVAKNKFSLDN
jgi:CRP-like cAMP-binding protein